MHQIPLNEVTFLQKRQRDDTGRVFVWQDRIFRGVLPEREEHVGNLFSTGLLDELMQAGRFPKTWKTDYRMEGFSSVLEHERIWPVLYPQEWTVSMLRDAALAVYDVSVTAKKHGFNMRDCHGLNVLFDGVSPKFIDLGSFIPDEWQGWMPYEEFLRFYYYPLKIWQTNEFLGKLSIFSGNLTPHEAYLRHEYRWLRKASPNLMARARNLLVSRQTDKHQEPAGTRRKSNPRDVLKSALGLDRLRIDRVTEEIRSMNPTSLSTAWGGYHEEVKEKAERFARILELVNGLEGDIKSAVDLGGNQGRFSRLLIEQTKISRAVCVDADQEAINRGYETERKAPSGKLTLAHYDFMGPIAQLRYTLPADRLRADAAFALALSHHLVLRQGYDIADVFEHVKSYARKYVFIEFMPRGLWSTGQEVSVPAWYTVEWFRAAFQEHFKLLREEQLRVNNILFVGQV